MGPCGALHTYLVSCVRAILQWLAPGSRTSSRVSNWGLFSMGPYGALHASGNTLGTASFGGYLLYGPIWSSPYMSRVLCLGYPGQEPGLLFRSFFVSHLAWAHMELTMLLQI